MTCETLQGKYAEKIEREKKKMNKEIELLYKKLDAQDVIINEQTLEIAKLKNRLKNEKKVAQEYREIEERIDKANDGILNEIYNFCNECGSHLNCPEDECVLYRIEQIVLGGENVE